MDSIPGASPPLVSPSRILAVRPEPALAAVLAETLRAGTYELTSCTGDVEALCFVRSQGAEVVITDASTTIEEDLAFTRELMNLRPSVRVIVLAPAAPPAPLIEAIRARVFACFTPPIDYREVAEMASTALTAEDWKDGIQVLSGLDHWLTLRVSCHLLTADRLVRFITELQPTTTNVDRDLLVAAFRELLLNSMEHGAGFDAQKVIEVSAAKTSRAIVFHFKDPGEGFDRADLQHAARATSPEAVLATAILRADMGLRPGGFGMLIARHVADELVYNERGNEVLLIKHLD
jgi:anti-sigma regulatory factor (Ser/Thr protein kinase)/CheY-like chemotaxis protein